MSFKASYIEPNHIKLILYSIRNVYSAKLMAGKILTTDTGRKMILS